nr:MBL fold metallo-hydrolase [Candidatus Omnitrophota bacterium]
EHTIRLLNQDAVYTNIKHVLEVTALSLTGYPARFFTSPVMYGRLFNLLDQPKNRARPNVVRFLIDVLESAGVWDFESEIGGKTRTIDTSEIPKGRFFKQPNGNLLWMKHTDTGDSSVRALHQGTLGLSAKKFARLPRSVEVVLKNGQGELYAVTAELAAKLPDVLKPGPTTRDTLDDFTRLREALEAGYTIKETAGELPADEVKRMRKLILREIEILGYSASVTDATPPSPKPSAQFPSLDEMKQVLAALDQVYDPKTGKRLDARSEVRNFYDFDHQGIAPDEIVSAVRSFSTVRINPVIDELEESAGQMASWETFDVDSMDEDESRVGMKYLKLIAEGELGFAEWNTLKMKGLDSKYFEPFTQAIIKAEVEKVLGGEGASLAVAQKFSSDLFFYFQEIGEDWRSSRITIIKDGLWQGVSSFARIRGLSSSAGLSDEDKQRIKSLYDQVFEILMSEARQADSDKQAELAALYHWEDEFKEQRSPQAALYAYASGLISLEAYRELRKQISSAFGRFYDSMVNDSDILWQKDPAALSGWVDQVNQASKAFLGDGTVPMSPTDAAYWNSDYDSVDNMGYPPTIDTKKINFSLPADSFLGGHPLVDHMAWALGRQPLHALKIGKFAVGWGGVLEKLVELRDQGLYPDLYSFWLAVLVYDIIREKPAAEQNLIDLSAFAEKHPETAIPLYYILLRKALEDFSFENQGEIEQLTNDVVILKDLTPESVSLLENHYDRGRQFVRLYPVLKKLARRSELRSQPQAANLQDPIPQVQTMDQIQPYLEGILFGPDPNYQNKALFIRDSELLNSKFGHFAIRRIFSALHSEISRRFFVASEAERGELKTKWGIIVEAKSQLLDPDGATVKAFYAGTLDSWIKFFRNEVPKDSEKIKAVLTASIPKLLGLGLSPRLFFYFVYIDRPVPPEVNEFLPLFLGLPADSDIRLFGKPLYDQTQIVGFLDHFDEWLEMKGARQKGAGPAIAQEFVGLLFMIGPFFTAFLTQPGGQKKLGAVWGPYFIRRFDGWLNRWQAEPEKLFEKGSSVQNEWMRLSWEWLNMPSGIKEAVSENEREVVDVFMNPMAIAPQAKSEVRSFFGKQGPDIMGELFDALSSSGLKFHVVEPPESKSPREIFEKLPDWMARGYAIEAWGDPSLNLTAMADSDYQTVLAAIGKKAEQAGLSEEPGYKAVLDHLSKIDRNVFDEQRWADQPKKMSYLIAHADSHSISVGRGALAVPDFAAELFFRSTVESLNQMSVLTGTPKIPPGLSESLFGAETQFRDSLVDFTALRSDVFLFDAVRRFKQFDVGGTYYRTYDLLSAWIDFDMKHKDDERDAQFAVLEQAGFLTRQLFARYQDDSQSADRRVIDAFFRVTYPFLTFAMTRYELFRDVKVVYNKIEQGNEKDATDFMALAKWIHQAIKEAPEYPKLHIPLFPDRTVSTDIDDLATMIMMRTAKEFGREYDPTSVLAPPNLRLTREKILKFLKEKTQVEYSKGERSYTVMPMLALYNSVEGALTPQNAEHMLEDEHKLFHRMLSDLEWLNMAIQQYDLSSKDADGLKFSLEGFVLDKPEVDSRDFDPILDRYSHLRSGDEIVFSDNVFQGGIWLGRARVLTEDQVAMGKDTKAMSLNILTVGEGAITSRAAAPREVQYHQTESEGLSLLIHKNSVTAELIDWAGAKLRASQEKKPFDVAVRGRWTALTRAGLSLYASPRIEEGYFAPRGADLDAWTEDILRLRSKAESSYWRTVRHMQGQIDWSQGVSPAAGRLELYQLLRNADGLLANLADKLEYQPGSKRLTPDAAKAVVNTLYALIWSGAPRSTLIYTTALIVLDAFNEHIGIHPDGITVADLDGFKRMLTSELSDSLVEDRDASDFQAWASSTSFAKHLNDYDDPDAWRKFNFLPASFYPPDIDPATGRAPFAHLRSRIQPTSFDAEEFPAEDFLNPEKWPKWIGRSNEIQAEWVGTYTKQGLQIPGAQTVYYFEPSSGILPGDLVKAVVTWRPDQEKDQLKLRLYKYTPAESTPEAAKSEVRIIRNYALLGDYFERSVVEEDVTKSVSQATAVDTGRIDEVVRRLQDLTEKTLLRNKSPLSQANGVSAILNVLDLLKNDIQVLEFPEIRRLDQFGDQAFLLVSTDKNRIYVSKELLASEGFREFSDFMLMLAAVDANNRAEGGWGSEDKRHIMEILQVMFEPWEKFADMHDDYISEGVAIVSESLESARSPRGAAGKKYGKAPRWDDFSITALESEEAVSSSEEGRAGQPQTRLPQIKADGYYSLAGGSNGLFYFEVNQSPVAVDIRELTGQTVRLHVSEDLSYIDFYSGDGLRLVGTLLREEEKKNYRSLSQAVRFLAPLQPVVAHLKPETTIQYQNLRTLAAHLGNLLESGRGYSRIDFLESEPLAEQPKALLDVAHGVVYLAPSLAENELAAEAALRKALKENDPLVRLNDALDSLRALPIFGGDAIPSVPQPESKVLLSQLPSKTVRYYEQLRKGVLETHHKIENARTLDRFFQSKASSRYKDIQRDKFRTWLTEALNKQDSEFYFSYQAKGAMTRTEGLDSLRWENSRDQEYLPYVGVGIATPKHFVTDASGQFRLGRSGNNPDETRYLFIRYKDPQNANKALIDVFDLATGQPIEDQKIQYERLAAEVKEALDQLMKQADNKEETRLDLQGLRNRLEVFINGLEFSPAFKAEYARRPGQEPLDSLLLKTKAYVLGAFNQLLSTILNSKEYSSELNFAVLELILHYVGKKDADDAQKNVERLLRAYRLKPERLLDYLSLHLMEMWSDFDPSPAESSSDPNADRIRDFLGQVLIPVSDWAYGEAKDLSGDDFIEDTVFTSILGVARMAIESQVDLFLAQQNPEEVRNSVLAFESRFKQGYQPVQFLYKPPTAGVTSLEEYLIDAIFRSRQEAQREISQADAAERATYHTQYGAGEGIGASSALFQYRDSSVLLDAGVMIDGKNTRPAWPAFKKEPDAIILSHAHLDHVGA